MVRKKKKREEEAVTFCYYCDRVFADETTLIQHQKARHYKCSTCHKKLNTIQGLSIHCSQVHKITVETVPNALPGRGSVNVEIFGMAGVPEGAAPGVTVPTEDESDSKRAATGQGITSSAAQGAPAGPIYPGQAPPAASYAPQYGAPMPYGYPPAGAQLPAIYPPGYMQPPVYPPQRPGQPPMSLPPMRPAPGMPFPQQAAASLPTHSGQPPGTISGGAPAAGQPLFPISSSAAAGQQPAPTQASTALPGGSLFPINIQEPAAVLSNTHTAASAQSGPGYAAAASTAGPTTAAAATADVDLVWQEENVSMEERRALLSKYAPKGSLQAPQASAPPLKMSAPVREATHIGHATQVPSNVYQQ